MAALSVPITLLALAVVPPFVLLDRLLAKRVTRLSRYCMNLNAPMTPP